MEAGRLRHLIEIQSYVEAQDPSSGDDTKTWNGYPTETPPFAKARAEIVTSGGRELFAAQQQLAEADAIIKIRFIAGVNERMRVYHKAEDVFYNVLNVRPDDRSRREFIILICSTGVLEDA